MNQGLLDQIRPVMKKMQRIRFWRTLLVIALVTALAGWLMKEQVEAGQVDGKLLALVLFTIAVGSAVISFLVCRLSFRNPRTIARQIESSFPNLDGRLLTALSQEGDDLGYLQRRVIGEAKEHSTRHRWTDAVSSGQLVFSRLLGLGAFAALYTILLMLTVSEAPSDTEIASQSDLSTDVQIIPGDVEIERGTSLVVTARFSGSFPESAELVCVAADGSERRYPMTQNLSDPVLGAFLPAVNQATEYRIESQAWESDTFDISVFEFPALVRSDANLKYPEYTQLSEKLVEDTVRVSAVEGTEVTWLCYLNKTVQSAELVAKDGNRIPLQGNETEPGLMSATLNLNQTMRMKLELIDNAGRKNSYPPELIARMLPNQSPNLKLTIGGDVTVSPLEELPLGATVRDDYGVAKYGLSYTFEANEPKDILLGEDLPRAVDADAEYLIEFEALMAEPDQLLVYHFWEEDFGPDGQLRRTESDMYFAEVRPFDEIFRQGEQPPGGQEQQQQQQQQEQQGNQNGQQAQELAELQKEIINATWRVVRDQRPGKLTETFSADVRLIDESQATALEQLEELGTQVRDERSTAFVDNVRDQMLKALSDLASAETEQDTKSLRSAMTAEQAAYAGLLKLRAREYQVMQQQQQQQSQQQSRSQQQRQQQINELELDQEENRYETQQQAQEQPEQDLQEREVRQVLNRLRDLARRQEDLNEELAQLQSALERAETEEEREEIERQLKRLREQQQDLLREVDELADRMQSPENQEQMANAAEQLEETRENVRRASDALEQNDASEALTAGRRAEREFEEMRDEFRQRAAGQFNEAVRDMRREAQEIDERQEELSEQLRETEQPAQAGLRAKNDRDELEEKLQDQRERLGELLEQMQETVEQSEVAEPLLAQKLYDSFRRTQQRQTDRQLNDTAELVRRGFDAEAREVEREASEGLDQLRQELEDAASTVLGDETRALERALSELEQLDRDLQNELQENQSGQQTGEQSGQQTGEQSGQQTGEQSGQQTGEQSGQQTGEQSGQQPGEQSGQQPGEQSGRQPGEQTGQQPGEQSGQQPGEQTGQQSGEQTGQEPGQEPGQQPGQQTQRASEQSALRNQQAAQDGGGLGRYAAESPSAAPLTGDGFREWSDRLRDVEEMVDDPEMRSEAARIRDRAREIRRDFRRRSEEPQWDLVEELLAEPLRELKQNVSEELMRRSAEKHAPVPLDRDPVPAEFSNAVQKYYESLGSGR
ncbi:MAG: hypothetical protein VYA84_20205 [Planctomycetota bacterium]|nr:hypothetical protein [Planctomycetota bacterium]